MRFAVSNVKMPRIIEQRRLRSARESGELPAAQEALRQDHDDIEFFLMMYFRARFSSIAEAVFNAWRYSMKGDVCYVRSAILATISTRYVPPRHYLPRNTAWISEVLPSFNDK